MTTRRDDEGVITLARRMDAMDFAVTDMVLRMMCVLLFLLIPSLVQTFAPGSVGGARLGMCRGDASVMPYVGESSSIEI